MHAPVDAPPERVVFRVIVMVMTAVIAAPVANDSLTVKPL